MTSLPVQRIIFSSHTYTLTHRNGASDRIFVIGSILAIATILLLICRIIYKKMYVYTG